MPLDLWPRLLLVRLYLMPLWLLSRARRFPRRVVTVAAVLVLVAGLGVVAAWRPAGECKYRVIVGPGRARMVCAAAGAVERSEIAATGEEVL